MIFRSSWSATKHDTSNDGSNAEDKVFSTELASCIGTKAPAGADDDSTGEVHSPDFKNGDSEIDSSAHPAKDVAAERKFNSEVLASSKADSCFGTAVRQALGKDAPSGASIDRVSAHVEGRKSGQPADVAINFAADLTLSAQGQTVTLSIALVDILTDRVEAEIDFNGFGAPIDSSTQTAAVAAVAKRAATA